MRASTKKVSPSSKTKWDMSHESMLYNVVNMALSIIYGAVTASISALNSLILGIQANLATIATLRNITRSPITGYAAQKKAVRTALELISTSVMNSAYSFGVASGNIVFADQMNNAASRLHSLGYRQFLETVRAAIDNVNPFVIGGELIPYGVTGATMTAWTDLANSLDQIISNPQFAIANRTATNDSIQALLLDCMVVLTNSGDTLVSQLRGVNDTYYNAYWSSRRLHEHHQPTQLRFYVLDQAGRPVTAGEVFILGTDKSAFLDENGYALVDHIPFGNHTVTLTTPFNTFNYGPFRFKKGKVKSLHVQIEIDAVSETTSSSVTKEEETETV